MKYEEVLDSTWYVHIHCTWYVKADEREVHIVHIAYYCYDFM